MSHEKPREDQRRSNGRRMVLDRRRESQPVAIERRSGQNRRSGGNRRPEPDSGSLSRVAE